MENITRRLFLRRGASVAAVSSVALAPVAAAAMPRPEENPELLAIGEELKDLSAEYESAAQAKGEARARYHALVPAVPVELVVRQQDVPWGLAMSQHEVDVDGRAVYPTRHIFSAKVMEADHNFRWHRKARTPHYRKVLQRLCRVAKEHEKAVAEAREASGYDPADDAEYFAGVELAKLAERCAKVRALTVSGLFIKAGVYEASIKAREHKDGLLGRGGYLCATDLVSNMMVVAEAVRP